MRLLWGVTTTNSSRLWRPARRPAPLPWWALRCRSRDGASSRCWPSMLAVDAAGVRVAYRKTWLGGNERTRFHPGDGPTVLEVDGVAARDGHLQGHRHRPARGRDRGTGCRCLPRRARTPAAGAAGAGGSGRGHRPRLPSVRRLRELRRPDRGRLHRDGGSRPSTRPTASPSPAQGLPQEASSGRTSPETVPLTIGCRTKRGLQRQRRACAFHFGSRCGAAAGHCGMCGRFAACARRASRAQAVPRL